MWVITRAINDYNQDGDYLMAVFYEKPNEEQLKRVLKNDDTHFLGHMLEGGGRISLEHEWYYLTEIKSGEIYKEKE